VATHTVLIVEDDAAIADSLAYHLGRAGYRTLQAADGGTGLRLFRRERPDIIILDLMLPQMDGWRFTEEVRSDDPDVPVIMCSARTSEHDRVHGLEIGADDYVTKPFSPRELVARVRAILRRSGSGPAPAALATPSPSTSGNAAPPLLTHDAGRKRILCSGTALELTAHEYHLLLALMAHPGRVFSRDQLMDLAWEDPASASDRTVDAHIKTLRAKLRLTAPTADPIETRRGLGYALREDAA